MSISPLLIEKTVREALEEDLGHGFDLTTAATIPAGTDCRAEIISREKGILSGLISGLTAFSQIDPSLDIVVNKMDGHDLKSGDCIAEIEGSAQSIMIAERVCLNFLTHLSGIASATRQYVDAVKGTNAKITCTRKTLPGLRAFQKQAVRDGGGINHRHGLDDAILIKDNHIAVCGGIAEALQQAKGYAGHLTKIEIEVDTLDQLEQVLKCGLADVVMLDNMDTDTMTTAVNMIDGKLVSEASGGVSLKTVKSIADTGVDVISVGALTHSVTALDIGLDIQV